MTAFSRQNNIIGENIKAARKAKGITQRALAEKLGIAFQNLSVWENGKGSPSAKYLMKLSEVLNISLEQLTSPNGINALLAKSLISQGECDESGTDKLTNIQFVLDKEIPRIIQQEIANNHSLKLIAKYLEEIIEVLKNTN